MAHQPIPQTTVALEASEADVSAAETFDSSEVTETAVDEAVEAPVDEAPEDDKALLALTLRVQPS